VSVLTGPSGTLSSHYHYLPYCISPHWTVRHSLLTLSLSPVLCQSSLGSQALSPHTITISRPVSYLSGQSGTLTSHYHYLLSCVIPHWAIRHSLLTLSPSPVLRNSLLGSQALYPHTITISCPVSVLTGQSGTISSHYHYLLSFNIPHWAVRHSLLTVSLSPVMCQSSLRSQALSPDTIIIFCPESLLSGQSGTLTSHYHYLLSCLSPQRTVRHYLLTPSLSLVHCQSSLGSQALNHHTITISCPVTVLTGQSGTLSLHYHYCLSCVSPHWAVRHSLLTLSLSPFLC
jgi:ferredoxin-like protein FixX